MTKLRGIEQRNYLGRRALWTMVVLCVGSIGGNAHAALVNLVGNGFQLQYDDTALGLYGTPTIVAGNVVRFVPASSGTQFIAAGNEVTNSSISFTIIPDANIQVAGLSLLERGDYKLFDADPSSGATPSVALDGTLSMTSADRAGEIWSAAIVPTTPLTTLVSDPGSPAQEFVAQASLGLNSVSAPSGVVWGGTRDASLTVTIDNTLTAFTDPAATNDVAFIEKKLLASPFELMVVTPVPEAPTSALLLGALAFLYRSRSSR